MAQNFENPFADYGTIVGGSRFIGRQQALQEVQNRIVRPSTPGNLAVIGDYRIGKSSLVYKAVMEHKAELLEKKRIPIWINLATYDNAPVFFRSLVTQCMDELEEIGELSESIRTAATRALSDELSWTEGYSRVQRFFEKVKRQGLWIVFILDEFDHARRLFQNDVSGFQGLRELSYRPEWRVTFVTMSRRSLRDIELQTQAISTLDLIFHKYYLGMFDEEDIDDFVKRFVELGVEITPLHKERIRYFCGGHPFLMEMLGYEILERYRETGSITMEVAVDRVSLSILNQFDHIIHLLREDKRLEVLLRIVFGPSVDLHPTDIEELLRYGLIRVNDQGEYVAFSPHFQAYLQLLERTEDSWTLWKRTEIALRGRVAATLAGIYHDQGAGDWIDKMVKAKPKLADQVGKWREAQQKEQAGFGDRASHQLLDFSYPKELFDVIFVHWPEFSKILGKDKNYWDERGKLLSRARNPLAHNRSSALRDFEVKTFNAYCQEILDRLDT